MSLKHLLNEEDISDIFRNDRLSVEWNANEFHNELKIDPILPFQCWDQFVGEILGTDIMQLGSLQDKHDTSMFSSLQETNQDIEQWVAEGEICRDLNDEPHHEEAHICYGTILRAKIRLSGSMIELNQRLNSIETTPINGHIKLAVIKAEAQFFVAFPDGAVVGEVNAQADEAFGNIEEQGHQLDLEVYAPIRPIQEIIQRATKGKEAELRVQINVYGPRTGAKEIGKELSDRKLYLQRPTHRRYGSEYENPHILHIPGFESLGSESAIPLEEIVPQKATSKTLKNVVDDVYSTLTRNNDLQGLEGDERLNTSLLQHQKTALAFMTQREDGPIPEKYKLWEPSEFEGVQCYRHVVTKGRYMLDPIETGGGILSDEMGMGKSLSILALILKTLGTAQTWTSQHAVSGDEPLESWRPKTRVRASLIVASSDLMINEWFQELEKHFDEPTRQALSTIKYHGYNRNASIDKLAEADIVITTYHTLASEFTGAKSALRNYNWYRLVLDEAHIIRRQSTVLYRAVAEIEARSRWCLTGTPIQNRLEDIGSLFAFLRIDPFHSLSNFRKHISIPFDEGGKRRAVATERFARLLDSLCLRRTKELLHLPNEESRVRRIHLSPEERKQYNHTQEIMFRAVRNQNGVFDQKSTLGMFQVQLQLRIICNHGTWQQPFSWSRRKLHLLDEREALEASLGQDAKASRGAWRFQRIDGECPTAKRERILHEFTHDDQLRVLIMTTGTGAVGLNLATANRVFIVEPQWNPSVENQAIARALRLGQKQPVLVTRYVVEQTVEQDMRALQDRKLERADLVK
ncbi:dna repair and recombination protein rad5c [Stemphylium lycopersici]|uniref:Dna repair and recombination protein rad5c n=1 Tax=Stemphylium lycopersici TaxID=183478 RepID=A0A364N2N6_STELY|nr:dna repair and recombination protein rad5c [Stemphylium lycopersici]